MLIANPTEGSGPLKLGPIDASGAIGTSTITPSEAAMDRRRRGHQSRPTCPSALWTASTARLVITGDVAAVQSALTEVMNTLCGMMGFASAPITKT